MNTELAERKAPKTIKELLSGEEFKRQVALALPRHLTPDRFIRVALTAMMRTPKLAQCDQHSFFNALLTLSQLGLEPDGRRAHLIPFNNRKRNCVECQLIVDYKGLVELAQRSGDVANIHADRVCENDVFEYDRGEIKAHKVNFREPRGKAYAYYATCRFKNGTEKSEVMTLEEVQSIRARSRAGNEGPWMTDFDEMAKKTVFRRLSKWLTLSPEYRDALDADADTLEEARFQTARNITRTIAPPTFSDAAPEITEQGGGETEKLVEAPSGESKAAELGETPEPGGPSSLRDSEAEGPGEPPPFVAETPQEQIALALAEIDIKQTWFIEGLKRIYPTDVAKKAVTCADLSDQFARFLLVSGLDPVIEKIQGGGK